MSPKKNKKNYDLNENNRSDNEEFMLKEYEKIYDLYNINYTSSEKAFTMYFIIIGVFLTLITYIYNDRFDKIDLYNLDSICIIFLFIVSVCGFCLYMMLVEHKTKIILYARSINLIRKFFSDNNIEIREYLLLPTNPKIPKYFSLGKGFFWEICSFALINSLMCSLLLLNIISKKIGLSSNLFLLFVLTSIILLLHIILYALRGKKDIIKGERKK